MLWRLVSLFEYLPDSVTAPNCPCSSTTVSSRSPGKDKRKNIATPARIASPMRLFEIDDGLIVLPKGRGVYSDDLNLKVDLKKQEEIVMSRRSGRSSRAAPVFQSSPR